MSGVHTRRMCDMMDTTLNAGPATIGHQPRVRPKFVSCCITPVFTATEVARLFELPPPCDPPWFDMVFQLPVAIAYMMNAH